MSTPTALCGPASLYMHHVRDQLGSSEASRARPTEILNCNRQHHGMSVKQLLKLSEYTVRRRSSRSRLSQQTSAAKIDVYPSSKFNVKQQVCAVIRYTALSEINVCSSYIALRNRLSASQRMIRSQPFNEHWSSIPYHSLLNVSYIYG